MKAFERLNSHVVDSAADHRVQFSTNLDSMNRLLFQQAQSNKRTIGHHSKLFIGG